MAEARLALLGRFLAVSCALVPLPAIAQTDAEVAEVVDASRPSDPRDFSGVWMNDFTFDERLRRAGLKRLEDDPGPPPPPAVEDLPLTSEYREKYRAIQAERAKLAEGAEPCAWPGMPRIMVYPYPFEVLHTPGRITFIFEADNQIRRIFLDRSEHLPEDDLDPTYNGDSIGRWEGDTLVVDTVGFHEHTLIPPGLPHSGAMRIGERIRYLDSDTIEVRMVIEDPEALTRPIEQRVIYSKRPDWRIREYSCLENNRDAPDAQGERSGGVVEQ
ncbi:hypothetical protein [Tsuneonella sp. HG222]